MFRKAAALWLAALTLLIRLPAYAAPSDAPGETLGASGAVEMPADFIFTLDPYEKAGRGQIFADPLRIVNRGDQPVSVTITEMICALADETIECVQAVDPLEETGRKRISLGLRRAGPGPEEFYPIREAPGEPVSFTLGVSEEAVFELTGSMNPNPASPWRAGDIRLHFSARYEVIAAAEEAGETDTPAKEEPEELPEIVEPEPLGVTVGISPHPEERR